MWLHNADPVPNHRIPAVARSSVAWLPLSGTARVVP